MPALVADAPRFRIAGARTTLPNAMMRIGKAATVALAEAGLECGVLMCVP